jgi:hypothetical protein
VHPGAVADVDHMVDPVREQGHLAFGHRLQHIEAEASPGHQ